MTVGVLVLLAIAVAPFQEPDPFTAALVAGLDDSIAELKSADAQARVGAALILGFAGAKAQKAVPDLLVLMKDPVPRVRAFVALALGDIGPKLIPVREALEAALLTDAEGEVRSSAAASLGKGASTDSVGALVRALSDEDARTRLESLRALEAIESAAVRGASAAIRLLTKDPDADVRATAESLLKKLRVD
jgi:HEAT repeat protein